MIFSGIIPKKLISSWKENQLNRSKSIPQFYISVEGWRIDSEIHTAKYTIEIGLKTENGVMIFLIEKRFSDLRFLHQSLIKNEEIKEFLPLFPPKKLFGSNDISFIRNRLLDLKTYFHRLSSITNITKSIDFIECFSFVDIYQKWQEEILQEINSSKN